MTVEYDFAPAVAACFDHDRTLDRAALETAIRQLFDQEQPPPASKEELRSLHSELEALTGGRKIALVYGGATKIKDYVFEAPKLPEIRGASTILDWVNDAGLKKLWISHFADTLGSEQLVKQCIIYASGGSLLSFAPAALCAEQNVPDKIEQLYTQTTLTAQSAAVMIECSLLELRYGRNPQEYWVEDFLRDCRSPQQREVLLRYYYPPERVHPTDTSADALQKRFYNRKTFNELVTFLATMFYRRREERSQREQPRALPRYEMLPWAQKCTTSDVRSAVLSAPDLPDGPLLSEASARKAYIGRKVKRKDRTYDWFTRHFAWDLVPLPEPWDKRFLKHPAGSPYAASGAYERVESAQDVGEIGQASEPARYVGLIYADGNNVARYMGTTPSPGEYAARATKLTRAAEHAVYTALAKHLRPTEVTTDHGRRDLVHPFEILTIGGDDMILIVPGSKALDIALELGLAFEQMMGENQSPRLLRDRYKGRLDNIHTSYTPVVGLSAGVVIAQENTPIFLLRNLAEQLLKHAKKLARTRSQAGIDGGGAIDFMVLKSITMITDRIDTFREQALGDDAKPGSTTRRRTARPYTWHELDGLLHTARALQAIKFPRSQLYRLRAVLDTAEQGGVLVSSLEYLATRSRLSRYARTLLQYVESPWQSATLEHAAPAGAPPWLRMQPEGWESIWPDLAEIYELAAQARASKLEEATHA